MSDNETKILLVKFLAACVRIIAIGVAVVCATCCYHAGKPKVVRLQVEIVGVADAKEVAE